MFNSNSAYPQNLLINISNLQKAIQRSAKNLAVDQFSAKNVRNRDHISIVEDEKGEIMDNRHATPEKQIIDNLDIRRKMKEIKEYMYKKMDEKKSQSILYFMQGLSYEEISELLEVTKERARKIRCLALKELAQQFKGMKIEN